VGVRQQMFYAALSLAYHTRDPRALDTTAVLEELQSQYSPYGYMPDTHLEASFGHLDGYSALYYTYMWSLVIARDLFGQFTGAGMFDRNVATRYRRTILEPGGSRDAENLISDFLGRGFRLDAFEEWLEEHPS
jgi:thimet oligopeptidase